MLKRIRTYLILGIFTLLPTLATIYIIRFLFKLIDPTLGIATAKLLDWLGIIELPLTVGGIVFQTHVPGVGVLLTFALLIMIGMMTRSFFGRKIFRYTELFFSRIPLARSVYSTVKQITNTFAQDKTSFKKVVMVEYPRKNVYTLGFYTGGGNGEIQEKIREPVLNIFLPTTPNPTSGWLVLVPEKDVIFLDMSVEEGLKYIISGGMVVPASQRAYLLGKGRDYEERTTSH
ncbi:DUF502 domain-containing protein [Melghirimyces algeriensis]|uniref:Uncharacterized membrane protein n=1 Tax=Melghirimyces algeriensis TaxID=910412 RepID=A0A521BUN8_9BACL|nr:DUF502 domain-containing protein [Melghirimyces algeriensis]SMO50190.1 Uncharacterized membrane protein [Melghirimyces algeriensis]